MKSKCTNYFILPIEKAFFAVTDNNETDNSKEDTLQKVFVFLKSFQVSYL